MKTVVGKTFAEAVVLFAGAGGATIGLRDAGVKVVAAEGKKNAVPVACLEFRPYLTSKTIRPHYKLVNPLGDGMATDGSVFEAMLSWKGFAPNFARRLCTLYLKIEITHNFLRDYLGRQTITAFPDQTTVLPDRLRTKFADDPRYDFIRRLVSRPAVPQKIADYILCDDWVGNHADDFDEYLGLRADEPHRCARSKAHGNNVVLPLQEWGIDQPQVFDYWGKMPFDLELPRNKVGYTRSNCVFCFLKRNSQLKAMMSDCVPPHLKDTPRDINWWIRIEELYTGQNMEAGGFMKGTTYRQLEKEQKSSPYMNDLSPESLPCNCTD